MNTKDLAIALDRLAESIEPLSKEYEMKRARTISILKELDSLSASKPPEHPASYEERADSILNSRDGYSGYRFPPTYLARAHGEVCDLLSQWMETHGMGKVQISVYAVREK